MYLQRARARQQAGWQKELASTRDMQAQASTLSTEAQHNAQTAANLVRQAAHAAWIACELGALSSHGLQAHANSSLGSSSQSEVSEPSPVSSLFASNQADKLCLNAATMSATTARMVLKCISLQVSFLLFPCFCQTIFFIIIPKITHQKGETCITWCNVINESKALFFLCFRICFATSYVFVCTAVCMLRQCKSIASIERMLFPKLGKRAS